MGKKKESRYNMDKKMTVIMGGAVVAAIGMMILFGGIALHFYGDAVREALRTIADSRYDILMMKIGVGVWCVFGTIMVTGLCMHPNCFTMGKK